ncbi:MAG TPA: hypothetical protein VK147_12975 [Candidatus Didemnitutus sp.]|nr:hypothetical protein [Candidatus Didemnitutus sp.]
MTPQNPFNISDAYRYVATGSIDTVSGQATLTVSIDSQLPFYVRRHKITAFYVASGTARAVVASEALRDILLVDVKNASEKLTQNPVDIHGFNEECDDRNYPGYLLPQGSNVVYTISHEIITAANFGAPIKVRIQLYGYHMRANRQ